MEEQILISILLLYRFFPNRCLLAALYKRLLKKCCSNYSWTLPVFVVNILHYIQRACSFRVKPIRAMTVTTTELLKDIIKGIILTIYKSFIIPHLDYGDVLYE